MVRLNKVPLSEGVKCEVLAKCDFFNPGGSGKDRIAKRMIEDAEESGQMKPGDTIVEATSGNTGIGLAMEGAAKGYNVIITLPDKMSQEKSDTLNALGAKVVRVPNEASFYEKTSNIGVAMNFKDTLPNCNMLDQVRY